MSFIEQKNNNKIRIFYSKCYSGKIYSFLILLLFKPESHQNGKCGLKTRLKWNGFFFICLFCLFTYIYNYNVFAQVAVLENISTFLINHRIISQQLCWTNIFPNIW